MNGGHVHADLLHQYVRDVAGEPTIKSVTRPLHLTSQLRSGHLQLYLREPSSGVRNLERTRLSGLQYQIVTRWPTRTIRPYQPVIIIQTVRAFRYNLPVYQHLVNADNGVLLLQVNVDVPGTPTLLTVTSQCPG